MGLRRTDPGPGPRGRARLGRRALGRRRALLGHAPHPPRVDVVGSTSGEHVGLGGKLLVLSDRGLAGEQRDALYPRREAKDAADSGEPTREPTPDGVRFSARAGDRRAHELHLGVDDFARQEEGVLELSGTRVCPGAAVVHRRADRPDATRAMPNPQQEGRLFRADDQRKPARYTAFGETVPGRLGNSA